MELEPQRVACPNPACRAAGRVGGGNIIRHSTRDRRYRCTACGKAFAASLGTAFYRVRTPLAAIVQVLWRLVHRASVAAVADETGHAEDTIRAWLRRAARQADAVTAVLFRELHLSPQEVDEFWSFVYGKGKGGPPGTSAGRPGAWTGPAGR